MKTPLGFFYILFFLPIICEAQNPYQRFMSTDMKEFRKWVDPIPIDKEQEESFFNYAVKLYKQDSLQKSGQIFDRIYWLDTSGCLGIQALTYRSAIEKKIITSVNHALRGIWRRIDCPPAEANRTIKKNGKDSNKKLAFSDRKIIFYENGIIKTEASYQSIQIFNWVNGFMYTVVTYENSNEEWYYDIRELDSFTSDHLRIILKSSIGNDEYSECYKKN